MVLFLIDDHERDSHQEMYVLENIGQVMLGRPTTTHSHFLLTQVIMCKMWIGKNNIYTIIIFVSNHFQLSGLEGSAFVYNLDSVGLDLMEDKQ